MNESKIQQYVVCKNKKTQIKIKGLQTYSKHSADKYKPRESWSSNLNFWGASKQTKSSLCFAALCDFTGALNTVLIPSKLKKNKKENKRNNKRGGS